MVPPQPPPQQCLPGSALVPALDFQDSSGSCPLAWSPPQPRISKSVLVEASHSDPRPRHLPGHACKVPSPASEVAITLSSVPNSGANRIPAPGHAPGLVTAAATPSWRSPGSMPRPTLLFQTSGWWLAGAQPRSRRRKAETLRPVPAAVASALPAFPLPPLPGASPGRVPEFL